MKVLGWNGRWKKSHELILSAETVKTYLLPNMTLSRKLLFAKNLAGILKKAVNVVVFNAQISASKRRKTFNRFIEFLMDYSNITFVKSTHHQNKTEICISFFFFYCSPRLTLKSVRLHILFLRSVHNFIILSVLVHSSVRITCYVSVQCNYCVLLNKILLHYETVRRYVTL
jgi:hypothetical protein